MEREWAIVFPMPQRESRNASHAVDCGSCGRHCASFDARPYVWQPYCGHVGPRPLHGEALYAFPPIAQADHPFACPPQPYVYTSVDKKGRDKDVEVYLDERDPVYMNLRGLELHQVSDRIDRDVKVRKEATASSNKKVGCDGCVLARPVC
jgi:hypothetical protein